MIYLDNAATSWPKPPEVIRAMAGVTEKLPGNPGRGGHRGALAGGRVLLACREIICDMLGGQNPERVIFTCGCTDALNIAIKGLLHKGDEVLVSHAEHNAVMRPLSGLESRGEISISVLTPDSRGILSEDSVHQAVTPRTALCVLCHASNVTGVIQPAREIARACHKYGVPLLLDAAQSAGALDLSQTEADLIALPGHKGLLGPMGTGALYIAGDALPRPFREGGTGSQSERMLQPDILPDKYEAGTANLPGIAGLLAGARFALRHRDELTQSESALASRLRAGLRELGADIYGNERLPSLPVVSFHLPGTEDASVADALDKRKIAVRSGLHCAPMIHAFLGIGGAVRASLGPFTTGKDIDALLVALKDVR